MMELFVAGAHAGSGTALGFVGLALIAVAALLWLLYAWDDRVLKLKILAVGVAGLVLFIYAAYAALPPPLPTTDAKVIVIDKSTDYLYGLPAGVFDQDRTRHMMRNRLGGWMWAPAGGPPYGLGWRIYVVKSGRYQLEVQYSAETSRPAEVRLDDQTLFTGLRRTTRNRWKPQWFTEGIVDLHSGTNRLAFFNLDGLPWIGAVRLTRLDAISKGSDAALQRSKF